MLSNSCKKNLPIPDNGNYQAINASKDTANPQSNLIPKQADTDEQLITLWLHGRSKHTKRAYAKDIIEFLKYAGKNIRTITLGDIQRYSDELFKKDLNHSSIRRRLASIKSLFSFAHRIGYIQFDVGRPLRIPTSRDNLAQRILTEEEVQKIISSVKGFRNKILIKTLYCTAMRISELVSLNWRNFQYREQGGQLTILGKGGKTNNLLIPQSLSDGLILLRKTSADDEPIFKSRKGGHLNADCLGRALKKIAIKAIGKGATAHFYRHSAASHSLEHGCPIHIVQKQLNHASIATTGKYLHARPTESISKYLKL